MHSKHFFKKGLPGFPGPKGKLISIFSHFFKIKINSNKSLLIKWLILGIAGFDGPKGDKGEPAIGKLGAQGQKVGYKVLIIRIFLANVLPFPV